MTLDTVKADAAVPDAVMLVTVVSDAAMML